MAFFPNLLIWSFILLVFYSGTIIYVFHLITKIIKYTNGQKAWDFHEIIIFIPIIIIVLAGITFFVFITKPIKINNKEQNNKNI